MASYFTTQPDLDEAWLFIQHNYSAFIVLPFFLPFYEKPLKTVGISIFHMIYHIVKRGVDCGIS